MKIPKKVKIGGHWYKVLLRKNRERQDGSSSLGSENSRFNNIWIDGNQAITQQESTLLHEIIEAINYLNHLSLGEKEISVLETNLYQVLKDNKLLK